MISQITIQNFGLIERIVLELDSCLNILTGETGAGKSIIIEGLRFALGERVKSSPLRDQDQACLVEVVFDLNGTSLKNHELLKDHLPDGENVLILQRQYFSDGRNKIKVNGATLTLSQLKILGDLLVDFHGPNDHQRLLMTSSHIEMLDRLTHFDRELAAYQKSFQHFLELKKKQSHLQELSQSRERDLDILKFQVRELEQVRLTDDEHTSLLDQQTKIDHAEKLFEEINELQQILDGSELNLSELIQKAFAPIKTIAGIDEKTAHWQDYLQNIQQNAESLLGEIRAYQEQLSFQPQEAQAVIQKVDLYDLLLKKYGPTIPQAQNFYTQAKEKLGLLVDFEHNDQELQNQIDKTKEELRALAQALTQLRKKSAKELKKTVIQELHDLGFEHIDFEIKFEEIDFKDTGHDQVIFYISPNAGEPLKPLSEIVSSGEAARLMLALKKALTKVDPIAVLVFDEIDAQIGGRLGTITGKKLKSLAQDRQIVLITHLPQIASFADCHFKVEKSVIKGRTITSIVCLNNKERVQELSLMMGSARDQDQRIARNHAESMLEQAQKA